jgi:hypothetical protein
MLPPVKSFIQCFLEACDDGFAILPLSEHLPLDELRRGFHVLVSVIKDEQPLANPSGA